MTTGHHLTGLIPSILTLTKTKMKMMGYREEKMKELRLETDFQLIQDPPIVGPQTSLTLILLTLTLIHSMIRILHKEMKKIMMIREEIDF